MWRFQIGSNSSREAENVTLVFSNAVNTVLYIYIYIFYILSIYYPMLKFTLPNRHVQISSICHWQPGEQAAKLNMSFPPLKSTGPTLEEALDECVVPADHRLWRWPAVRWPNETSNIRPPHVPPLACFNAVEVSGVV